MSLANGISSRSPRTVFELGQRRTAKCLDEASQECDRIHSCSLLRWSEAIDAVPTTLEQTQCCKHQPFCCGADVLCDAMRSSYWNLELNNAQVLRAREIASGIVPGTRSSFKDSQQPFTLAPGCCPVAHFSRESFIRLYRSICHMSLAISWSRHQVGSAYS